MAALEAIWWINDDWSYFNLNFMRATMKHFLLKKSSIFLVLVHSLYVNKQKLSDFDSRRGLQLEETLFLFSETDGP